MEKTFRDILMASTYEIICLPIFVYVYAPNGLVFWLLLMAMDAYLVKRIPLYELIRIIQDEQYKKQQYQLLFMQVAFFIGLVIVAFHSLPLAGILLLNDIVVDFLAFFMAVNDKKNK